MLEAESLRSAAGAHCAPAEGYACPWSGKLRHPDDLRECSITGIPFGYEHTSRPGRKADFPALAPLAALLDGISHKSDVADRWPIIAQKVAASAGLKTIEVVSAELSPSGNTLALCCVAKSLFGLRVRHIGALYSVGESSVLGRVVLGQRMKDCWIRI